MGNFVDKVSNNNASQDLRIFRPELLGEKLGKNGEATKLASAMKDAKLQDEDVIKLINQAATTKKGTGYKIPPFPTSSGGHLKDDSILNTPVGRIALILTGPLAFTLGALLSFLSVGAKTADLAAATVKRGVWTGVKQYRRNPFIHAISDSLAGAAKMQFGLCIKPYADSLRDANKVALNFGDINTQISESDDVNKFLHHTTRAIDEGLKNNKTVPQKEVIENLQKYFENIGERNNKKGSSRQ